MTHDFMGPNGPKGNSLNAIIPISADTIEGQAVQTVNARDLHAFLESGDEFAHWIKDRIEKYGFVENQDFVTVWENTQTVKNGKTYQSRRTDYHVSLDMAKELAMVDKSEKGKQARRYFIECERVARAAIEPPKARKNTTIRGTNISGALIRAVTDFPDKLRRQFPNLSDSAIQAAYSNMTGIAFGVPLIPAPVVEGRSWETAHLAAEVGLHPSVLGKKVKHLKTAGHGEVRLGSAPKNGKQIEQFHWNANGRTAVLALFGKEG